jgi:segregation and condensation protein B
MEIGNIIPHIEALVFASDKPLTSMEITELINNAFGFMEEKLTLEQIQTALDGIIEKYASEFYPFEVRESGGGWQFLTKKDYHKTVAQLNGDKFLKRLSSAALETLSIIAYKQPITKGEIESIRGVSSDYSIQKLLEKELIVISGRNENMVGKPLIYTTSKTFMDYFGINSAEDLPKLKEVFIESLAEPTLINYTPGADATEAPPPDREALTEDGEPIFSVSEEGELLEGATPPPDAEGFPATAGPDTRGATLTAMADSEESDEQADEGDGTILDAADPDATAASIPPYADDDLAAEPTEADEAEGEEAFGEADEEGDDEAAGFDAEKEAHNPASDESDEDEGDEENEDDDEDEGLEADDEAADPPAHP